VNRQPARVTMTKPLLFGYLRLRITDASERAPRARRLLAEFADREGYTLAEVYVEADENRPCSALSELIHAVRRWDGAAIAVPELGDLGSNEDVRRELRTRLRRETGVPLLVLRHDQASA
jgi:hypothetical protein